MQGLMSLPDTVKEHSLVVSFLHHTKRDRHDQLALMQKFRRDSSATVARGKVGLSKIVEHKELQGKDLLLCYLCRRLGKCNLQSSTTLGATCCQSWCTIAATFGLCLARRQQVGTVEL